MWDYLWSDLGKVVSPPWLQAIQAVAAVLCGAVTGLERQRWEKPAGLRTLVLVCLGAAVFTMASFRFTNTAGDSGRVAAQIVTGIGFLGAGAILHGAGNVSGMTTAATVWVVAATGMVAGSGYVGAALALSLLTRLVLTGIYALEGRRFERSETVTAQLWFDPDRGKTVIRIGKLLDDYQVVVPQTDLPSKPEGLATMTVQIKLIPRHRRELLARLADLPAVREIQTEP